MKAVKARRKTWKRKQSKPPNIISIVYFLQTRLFTENFSPTSTIHPGIFRERALWADSVSSRMNTIALRDHFKDVSAQNFPHTDFF